MKHVMQHTLSPEVARKTAERAFFSYRERYAKYDPRFEWVGANKAKAFFRAKGFALEGSIELLPTAIALSLEVPFMLRRFEGAALARIERELTYWSKQASATDPSAFGVASAATS